MSIATYEGIIENGQVKLDPKVHLPDHTKVYVVVPALEEKRVYRFMSPRLVHPEDAEILKMEVRKKDSNG